VWKRASGRRLLLAFLATENQTEISSLAGKLRRSLKSASVSAGPKPVGGESGLFSHIKLFNETLISVLVETPDLAEAIQILQFAGARSVFIFASPGDVRSPAEKCEDSSFAQARHDWKAFDALLDKLEFDLRDANEYLRESARIGHPASPAAQWVVDNSYLASFALAEARIELKKVYKSLNSSQITRLWHLAESFVAADLPLKEEELTLFLNASQKSGPLNSPQLWSFLLFAKTVLARRVVELACRCKRTQHLRELAFLAADRVSQSAKQSKGMLAVALSVLKNQPFIQEPTFSVAFAEQLQDQETALRSWWADSSMETIPGLIHAEHARESKEGSVAASIFAALREIPKLDFNMVFDSVSALELTLRRDPAGVYPKSDFTTRDFARQRFAKIAELASKEEIAVASLALEAATRAEASPANQILYYAAGAGRTELEKLAGARSTLRRKLVSAIKKRPLTAYSFTIFALTSLLIVATAMLAREAGLSSIPLLFVLAALAAFPIAELVTQLVQALIVTAIPPEPCPKLDFRDGIPDEARTLVVIPMMMSSATSIRAAWEALEVRFLGNRQKNLSFALLADFLDAPAASLPGDAQLVDAALDGLKRLQAKYGEGHFAFFYRPRRWSDSESAWIGEERKRGKLEHLNAFFLGEASPISAHGASLNPVYVITLDADTKLPPRAALQMIEAIAHPLNRVTPHPHSRLRQSGYAIVQPRVSIALPGANASRFTQIFSDAHGTDPYCTLVSDAQQDLFGEGIFHGKAIYELASFHRILSERFPRESILSHDLIEGAHTGVRYASDIELLEDMPVDYATFAARQHRWIRGDWQIWQWATPWIPGRDGVFKRNTLSALNRWRIADNLRRSLTPIAAFLLLLFGWMFTESPGVWSMVLALGVGIPALAPILERWTSQLEGTVYGWRGALDDAKRALVMLAFLPHQAWLSADAIVRALYRKHVSRKKLLEWRTAESASRLAKSGHDAVSRQIAVCSAGSCLVFLWSAWSDSIGAAWPLIALWIASPLFYRWLKKPLDTLENPALDDADELELRSLARLTWRYFDDLVGDDSNWLPPDNTQLALRIEVAQRTSPTNIGLWLNSAEAAYDFGFITAGELLNRCNRTFDTLERMERYEGHFYNWYSTAALEPLEPKYVSTVDSGNLIASLWLLAGCAPDAAKAPVLPDRCFAGLSDTLRIIAGQASEDTALNFALRQMSEALRPVPGAPAALSQLRLLEFHVKALQESTRWSSQSEDQLAYWIAKLKSEITAWVSEADGLLRWLDILMRPSDESVRQLGETAVRARRRLAEWSPSREDLAHSVPEDLRLILDLDSPSLKPELRDWLAFVESEYRAAQMRSKSAINGFLALAERANACAERIDMSFLYDSQRRLFGIGYVVGHPRAFNSHYDLLASECRLASLVSIAKGDVPIEHWFVLGRPWINTPSRKAMLSWSGTMFEYLMPVLFLEPFRNSLLQEACVQAVEAQMAFPHPYDDVWGISESAYGALDARQTYQYRAFGVPALALNPAVDSGPVLSPYSTLLALMVKPVEALENIRKLSARGLMGKMGLYEAIDYTRPARKGDRPGVIIYAYMAHHQAMSLLSLSNAAGGQAMQRVRFHRDPRIKAVEPLLFERVPIAALPAPDSKPQPGAELPVAVEDRNWTEAPFPPKVFAASNGDYALMVSSSGGSRGTWKGIALNRWRADLSLDESGHFIWLRDRKTGRRWCASHPFQLETDFKLVTFSSERAEFVTKSGDLEAKVEIVVAPEGNGELRRVVVSNRGLRRRQLDLTLYAELAMAPAAAHAAHPAFSQLFIQTFIHEDGLLLAKRRPRSPEEKELWVACLISGCDEAPEYETSRAAFLGRNRELPDAAAFEGPLGANTGTVLDPVFAFRAAFELDARDQCEIQIATVFGHSRDEAVEAAARFRKPEPVAKAIEMAWFRSQLEFRHFRIDSTAAHRYQELAAHLIYPNARYRSPAAGPVALGQEALWRFGISGDLPMVVISMAGENGIPLLRDLLLAKAFLRIRGIELDLIIPIKEEPGYEAPLRKVVTRLMNAHLADVSASGAGRAYALGFNDLSPEERQLLLESAHVALSGARGGLQRQLFGQRATEKPATAAADSWIPEPRFEGSPPGPNGAGNGVGAFSEDGKEYEMRLGPGTFTPMPWANVIANERFGVLVTENGIGATWCINSQQNRLTPWRNDTVLDRPAEVVYLRDEETSTVWSCTPGPNSARPPARVVHGQGYSKYLLSQAGIETELTVLCASSEAVKLLILRLRNTTAAPKKLSTTHFAEWVLGTDREFQQARVQSWFDAESGMLCATQHWSRAFAGRISFAASSAEVSSYSGDRGAFLGSAGSYAKPLAMARKQLDNAVGKGMDPCAALRCVIDLPAASEATVVFVMGQAETIEEAGALAARFANPETARSELLAVQESWDETLGALQIQTPDPTVNWMMNRWLLYQSLSCRFWGRTSLYQSGGALGFRDQLQDCLAFVYARPELTRSHILRAAAHQFPEGDVAHWWHPVSGLGVRTLCSDDLLWLPWIVARYLEITGDSSILKEEAPFIEGEQLRPGEHEKMLTLKRSELAAPLLEHCLLSLERASAAGPHGLPLMGNGDWNDGMNRIGSEGRGESVWLAWFYCDTLRRWAPFERYIDGARWKRLGDTAGEFARAAENSAWDGDWYRRAFFDDGTPLGTHAGTEAQIDSLPQSWAVISKAADPERARRAVHAAYERLVRPSDGAALLFTPPFDKHKPHPGYIMGYPPGVRENGGQYTHGSLWLAQALAQLDLPDLAFQILNISNPAARTLEEASMRRYGGEPYAVAADISSSPGREGHAGWTWYTGSSGWMYRIWLEDILGFRLQGGVVSFAPKLPSSWDECTITYRYRSATYRFRIRRQVSASAPTTIELKDDGATHDVEIGYPTSRNVALAEEFAKA
jgi:cyclic beta-1,2-glucan synthetase